MTRPYLSELIRMAPGRAVLSRHSVISTFFRGARNMWPRRNSRAFQRRRERGTKREREERARTEGAGRTARRCAITYLHGRPNAILIKGINHLNAGARAGGREPDGAGREKEADTFRKGMRGRRRERSTARGGRAAATRKPVAVQARRVGTCRAGISRLFSRPFLSGSDGRKMSASEPIKLYLRGMGK